MGGIGILGVILLSTPPPEETPKASISSYCVKCDLEGTYEIIMYHGGGEAIERDLIRFHLKTSDGGNQPITPWWVYEGTPEDCMYSDISESSLTTRGTWRSQTMWKSGETLRFRFVTAGEPVGIDARYYPYTSPMSVAEYKDEIRNSTCVRDNNPTGCQDPTGELTPVLISPNMTNSTGCFPPCSDGNCQAVFTYTLGSGDYTIPVHRTGKPYNFYNGSEDFPDPGIEEFHASQSGNKYVKVNFSSPVQWWLGRSMSETTTCG